MDQLAAGPEPERAIGGDRRGIGVGDRRDRSHGPGLASQFESPGDGEGMDPAAAIAREGGIVIQEGVVRAQSEFVTDPGVRSATEHEMAPAEPVAGRRPHQPPALVGAEPVAQHAVFAVGQRPGLGPAELVERSSIRGNQDIAGVRIGLGDSVIEIPDEGRQALEARHATTHRLQFPALRLTLPSLDTVIAHSGDRPPILALVPHQDDELLIMGPALRNAVEAGRGVQLVLFGLGDGTIVRTRDMPRLLGYEPTGEEIGRVRDREFAACAARLGLPASAVAMAEPRQSEGGFVHAITRRAVRAWTRRMPYAEVWVVSEYDANPDHATMGLVVRELWAEGEIVLAPRMFVAPWHREIAEDAPLKPETARIGYWEQAQYRFTDVDAGAWGVGLKSVRRYFDDQLLDPTAWSYSLASSG